MNAKHTPGPWVASRHDGFCDTEWRIKPARPIKGSSIGFAPHAVVKGDLRIVTDAEREANARLIASAPDLLVACEGAVQSILDADAWGAVVALRAAIAKAKGE